MKQKELKRIRENLIIVSEFASECDDWVAIKKELLKTLPSNLRSCFSKRHPITKEQQTNTFELELINYYKKATGRDLKIRTLAERRKLNNV